MVSAMIRGHLTQEVQPCLKHFPGHGDTSTDSHFALPRIDTSLEVLREREFVPFIKGIRSKCPLIMSAHILNSKLDGKYPATLSNRVLQDILRGELGYRGVVVSDDMEMKAMTDHFGAKEAPVRAIQAGCDLLLYRTEEACRLAYEGVIQALN
jgi:beta-N-acetylhexosaminidase